MNGTPIHFTEALQLVLDAARPLGPVFRTVREAHNLVLAENVSARSDSPSADVSLRDGYALRASSLATNTHGDGEFPVLGAIEAGSRRTFEVSGDSAVRIMTGAPLPSGADVVVPSEFARESRTGVRCTRSFDKGTFILKQGADCSAGQPIAEQGALITPSLAGLLTAAGIHRLPVYPRPFVTLLSTGNEVRFPGAVLHRGDLYASNLIMAEAWLRTFGFGCTAAIVRDTPSAIERSVETALRTSDVVVSFGGTGGGTKDFITSVLSDMGWKSLYRQVRMKPGKNTALGMMGDDFVFCLPGAPSAAEIALLELVLPCLFAMSGRTDSPFPLRGATCMDNVGEPGVWSRFLPVALAERNGELQAGLLPHPRNMKNMAVAHGILPVIEGSATPEKGMPVTVQVLRHTEAR